MKKYEIWMEGYAVTGNTADATLCGTVEAETFAEACKKHFKGDKDFDPIKLNVWGCRLFDNETDARKAFG